MEYRFIQQFKRKDLLMYYLQFLVIDCFSWRLTFQS